MANQLFGKARQAFANGDISWSADAFQAYLIDTSLYSVAIDTHEFLSDIPSGARVGAPVTLAGKTNVLGVCDANDVSHTGLTAAPTIEAIVLVQNTGVEGSSRLIAYIDTATGLPAAAGAPQVDVTWSNGADRIFKL